MSTPTRIKLKQAGEAIVLHCERAQVNTSGKWPEIEFIGQDAKTHQQVIVAAPQKSMERQFERLGLDLAMCNTLTLGISRAVSDDPDKPYWNLAVVGERDLSARGTPVPPAPKREPAPSHQYLPDHPVRGFTPEPPPPDDKDAPTDWLADPKTPEVPMPPEREPFADPLYLAITQWVLGTVAPLYHQFEIGPTPEAIAAMTATLYIQHNRNR